MSQATQHRIHPEALVALTNATKNRVADARGHTAQQQRLGHITDTVGQPCMPFVIAIDVAGTASPPS